MLRKCDETSSKLSSRSVRSLSKTGLVTLRMVQGLIGVAGYLRCRFMELSVVSTTSPPTPQAAHIVTHPPSERERCDIIDHALRMRIGLPVHCTLYPGMCARAEKNAEFFHICQGVRQDSPALLQVPTQRCQRSRDWYVFGQGPRRGRPDSGRRPALSPKFESRSYARGGLETGMYVPQLLSAVQHVTLNKCRWTCTVRREDW